MDVSEPSGGGAADNRNALFASINKGADITKGRRGGRGAGASTRMGQLKASVFL